MINLDRMGGDRHLLLIIVGVLRVKTSKEWLSEGYRSFNATKKQRNYVVGDIRLYSIAHRWVVSKVLRAKKCSIFCIR